MTKEAWAFGSQLKRLLKAQNMAIAGLFAAMYVVLSYFNIRISPLIEIRFPFLMLAAAGMFGGPVMAVVVAVLSDIISAVSTGAMFFPGFTFSYSLMGFLFGLIYYRSRVTPVRAVAGAAVEFVISLTLHTLWLSVMYGTPFPALFMTRLVKCAAMFFVNAVLLYLVLGAFRRVMQSLQLADGA